MQQAVSVALVAMSTRAPLLSTRAPAPRCCDNTAAATKLCRDWIDQHVIRLGLCPFAATPFVGDKIRYAVSEATTEEDLIHDFFVEGALLLDTDASDLATTMLVAPHYPSGIEEFYGLYEWLVDTLESDDEEVLRNGVQPAFFHPEWSFNGVDDKDPIHYEKRAPLPVINLLRRTDLNRVVEQGLEKGRIVNREIAEHNAAALEEEGWMKLEAMFRTRLKR